MLNGLSDNEINNINAIRVLDRMVTDQKALEWAKICVKRLDGLEEALKGHSSDYVVSCAEVLNFIRTGEWK